MANKPRGEVAVELGGAQFVLKYDMNALAELEDMLDASVLQLLQNPAKLGFRFLRALVYAGMLHDKSLSKGMTLEKVGRLIDPKDAAQVTEKALDAMRASFGMEGQEGAEAENPPEKPAG